jgi:choline kinase
MKAIVLSAGQGKRLLPLTTDKPKCLLMVDDERTVLDVQLGALARNGVERAVVVAGFGAHHVERHVERQPVPGIQVEIFYNPFFAMTDNLTTCWLSRQLMDEDFLLLNGDTLFEDRVVQQVLDEPTGPVTVTVDHKREYDDDDMKVSLDEDGRLLAIGKTLKHEMVSGESIGMLRFRGAGPKTFREALERSIRVPGALDAWYLSVINELAQDVPVDTASIRGLWWREIDDRRDLEEVRRSLPDCQRPEPRIAALR